MKEDGKKEEEAGAKTKAKDETRKKDDDKKDDGSRPDESSGDGRGSAMDRPKRRLPEPVKLLQQTPKAKPKTIQSKAMPSEPARPKAKQ